MTGGEKMTGKQLSSGHPAPVDPAFFRLPTLELARRLIGTLLVSEIGGVVTAGWIVETEAYIGPGDRAAHSYGNRRTPRTEVMFGPPGHAYVYVMHTHHLLNVVSGGIDCPEAVLIRAVEPADGLSVMQLRRGPVRRERDLTAGPGKLTKAMGIDRSYNGHPLFAPPLYIAEGREAGEIAAGPRIGIDNSGEAKDYPWRFWEKGNPFVSR
jgi:DNA-3-methyladenine glycosylase